MLILPNKRLDFTSLRVALVLHWHAFQRHRLLWCFTGYYFIDEERSHAVWRSSCALVYTFFEFVFAIFCSACPMSFLDDVGRSGASLASIWMTFCALVLRWLLFR